MGKREAGYYAVLPSEVRYDKNLTPLEKLLFCEINALADKKGYCWAKNEYFAELYDRHPRYISSVISKLEQAGYIIVDVDRAAGNVRKIYIGIQKKVHSYSVKPEYPIHKNMQPYADISDTPTIYNNLSEQSKVNKQRDRGTFVPPTLDEISLYCKEKGLSVDAKKFLDYYTESGWVDGKGAKVRNWKLKLQTWGNYGVRPSGTKQVQVINYDEE